MEEAAAVRRAATEAVGDVVPDRLRADIETLVEEGSMVPGALTLVAATAVPDGPAEFDALDGLVERAAGVQLIYDGLRLTRRLAHEDPWTAGDADAGDMSILAADVLVARGFYLLARTEAATRAVAVVRAFGRDQTHRRETDDPSFDRNLERDVVDLALVAGVTAAGRAAPADREGLVERLADDDGFPPAADLLDDRLRTDLATLAGGDGEGRAVERSGD
jgi:hypothetical protein